MLDALTRKSPFTLVLASLLLSGALGLFAVTESHTLTMVKTVSSHTDDPEQHGHSIGTAFGRSAPKGLYLAYAAVATAATAFLVLLRDPRLRPGAVAGLALGLAVALGLTLALFHIQVTPGAHHETPLAETSEAVARPLAATWLTSPYLQLKAGFVAVTAAIPCLAAVLLRPEDWLPAAWFARLTGGAHGFAAAGRPAAE